jgi:hypothetical protein
MSEGATRVLSDGREMDYISREGTAGAADVEIVGGSLANG